MATTEKITINFDMDGTIADFYGVENWLDYLINENPYPYMVARPLLRLSALARMLNRLQVQGYQIAIISWLSKSGGEDFARLVTEVKLRWLNQHLPSVHWDRITIVPYGTPKQNYCESSADILFDDEERNRINWTGIAYTPDEILKILKEI